jgi:hypothetical protein
MCEGDDEADEVVVAIPDHLDEYGQEALLRELRHKTHKSPRLLWRPIAAALTWLDQVQDALGDIRANDWMAVFNLGVDNIECTGFKLEAKMHNKMRYVIPIRERPTEPPGPSGVDWAVDAVNILLGLGTDDPGAFWQAFTAFPEIWQAMANRPWEMSELPRAWSKGDGWEEWSPPMTLARELPRVPVGGGAALWRLLGSSFTLRHKMRRGMGKAWGEHLKDEVTRVVNRMRGGRLRGAVVCGPLAQHVDAPWLSPFGMQAVDRPKPDALWLATGRNDPIATGARLYGQRLALKLPTYLDTLPQIATLALAQGDYSWVDLVKSTTCEGGNTYEYELRGQFKLQRECDWIEVYLKRQVQEAPAPEDLVPTPNLRESQLSAARKTVCNLGSLEAVRNDNRWGSKGKLREYALLFAEAYYNLERDNIAPYRKGKMRFPSFPEQDTVIDLKVQMRPASGLARVEFLPQQKEFLRGRQVFFDYSQMEDAYELPPLKRGWPETVKMPLTDDPAALTTRYGITNFLASNVHDVNYEQALNSAKNEWTSVVPAWQEGERISLKRVDQDGRAGSPEGQQVLAKLRDKIAEDFIQIKTGRINHQMLEKVIIKGTWLWGGTPQALSKHLEEYFKQEFASHYANHWRHFAEAASRCFTKEQQFELLFKAIHSRMLGSGVKNPFPNEAARSVYRLLVYRENAQAALSEDQAHAFLKESLRIIESELANQNIKVKFFQGVLLFFVLLRYRKVNTKFMDPDESHYAGIFEQVETFLDRAKACVRRRAPNVTSRISGLLDNIMAYVHFEGVPGIIQLLVQEAGD